MAKAKPVLEYGRRERRLDEGWRWVRRAAGRMVPPIFFELGGMCDQPIVRRVMKVYLVVSGVGCAAALLFAWCVAGR